MTIQLFPLLIGLLIVILAFNFPAKLIDALIRYTLDENGEYVLTFLSAGSRGNSPAVSRIEIDKGNGTTVTIAPEENKPFVYVMSRRWNVVVYAEDGSILAPFERKM